LQEEHAEDELPPCELSKRGKIIFFSLAGVIGLLQIPVMTGAMRAGFGYEYVFCWILAYHAALAVWHIRARRGTLPRVTKYVAIDLTALMFLLYVNPVYQACVFILKEMATHSFYTGGFYLNNMTLVKYLLSTEYVSRTAAPGPLSAEQFFFVYMMGLAAFGTVVTWCCHILLFSRAVIKEFAATLYGKHTKALLPPIFGVIYVSAILFWALYEFVYLDFNHINTHPLASRGYGIPMHKRILSVLPIGLSVLLFMAIPAYVCFKINERNVTK
jgi:hypothetical protein